MQTRYTKSAGVELSLRSSKAAVAAAIAATVILANGCYVTRLALKQNNLINNREPVSKVIADEKTGASTKASLQWSQEIIAYAQRQGLNTADSYRYFVDIPEGAISYTVQASEPFRFRSKTWWFPIVGSVPYIGFFEKSERDDEADRLKTEGLDVSMGTVSGFSSLGWFEDPIYSPMLRRSQEDLAHLLFHELTHRTFWAPGAVSFNEQLAEYVAWRLTKLFLHEKGLTNELRHYEAQNADQRKFETWVSGLKTALTKLYESFGKITPANAPTRKAAIIEEWTRSRLPRWQTAEFDFVAKKPWNNASIAAVSLYSPDYEWFDSMVACSHPRNMGEFLAFVKERIPTPGTPPDKILSNFCHF